MKFIHCKNCNEQVEFAKVSGEWFHSATYNTQCHPFGAHTEPTYAEPENEFEDGMGDEIPVETNVCKYCGSTIEKSEFGDYWLHDDGFVPCGAGDSPFAEPKYNIGGTVRGLQKISENPVESNSGSNSGSNRNLGQNSGQNMGQHEGDEAQPSQEGAGSLSESIISLYHTFHNTTLPIYDKLKAYDALNTLLKVVAQEEATLRLPSAGGKDSLYQPPQDVVGEHDT